MVRRRAAAARDLVAEAVAARATHRPAGRRQEEQEIHTSRSPGDRAVLPAAVRSAVVPEAAGAASAEAAELVVAEAEAA